MRYALVLGVLGEQLAEGMRRSKVDWFRCEEWLLDWEWALENIRRSRSGDLAVAARTFHELIDRRAAWIDGVAEEIRQ